ncbi:MAG: hypothetical protein FWD35_03965 [Oscillospiraceae bacterium]|nr:hypothetical protein [Oscillospiraceae bacterium]
MKDFSAKFALLLQEYPDAITDRAKLAGLLRDFFPRETRQVRLLTNLHKLSIEREIAKDETTLLDDKFALRFVKRLVEEYGIDEGNALWGVQMWCLAYGEAILGKQCSINLAEESLGVFAVAGNDAFARVIDIPGGSIRGVIETPRCNHKYANVYAVVYNYVMRNRRTPQLFRDMKTPFKLEYESVFRLIAIVLQLIKNNYIPDRDINPRYDGDVAELRCALMILNDYAALVSRLIGLPPCPALRITSTAKAITISLHKKAGIYVENCENADRGNYSPWLGQRINYQLTSANLKDLQYVLEDSTEFAPFREGQFEILRKLLSSNECAIIALPTGNRFLLDVAQSLQPVAADYLILDDAHCMTNPALPMTFEKIGGAAAVLPLETLKAFKPWETASEYSYTFDLLSFLSKLRSSGSLEESQTKRIVAKTTKKDFMSLVDTVAKVYGLCTNEARFKLHDKLAGELTACGLSYMMFFDLIYLTNKKDLIYYGVVASKINKHLEEIGAKRAGFPCCAEVTEA